MHCLTKASQRCNLISPRLSSLCYPKVCAKGQHQIKRRCFCGALHVCVCWVPPAFCPSFPSSFPFLLSCFSRLWISDAGMEQPAGGNHSKCPELSPLHTHYPLPSTARSFKHPRKHPAFCLKQPTSEHPSPQNRATREGMTLGTSLRHWRGVGSKCPASCPWVQQL